MYYQPGDGVGSHTHRPLMQHLAMTPSVAFRTLESQLTSFYRHQHVANVATHFIGPITPPHSRRRLQIADPVANAVSVYASKVLGQYGLLATNPSHQRISDVRDQINREITAFEHSLALDLARQHPDLDLAQRKTRAQATLAVAAYWFDRRELVGLARHPLLGQQPKDLVGATLYDYAKAALDRAFGDSLTGEKTAY